MKRLTRRSENGTGCYATPSGDPIKWDNNRHNVLQKLADYEDLEEQCLNETTFSLRMLLRKWKEFFEDIQELAEYRKLKKQGRLQILPCAVGDKVYVIMIVGLEFGTLKYQVYEAEVYRHHIDSFHLCVEIMIAENGKRIELVAETFGETVFLTREEAEAALEKMKGEDNG